MSDTSLESTFRPCSDDQAVSSRFTCTDNVRVEFVQCKAEATVQWSVARPEVSLIWVRDKGSNARITVAGGQADDIASGRANFWFFPEGVGAEGQVTGMGAYDCAGVSVDPSFLPSSVKQSLTEPIAGFTCRSLEAWHENSAFVSYGTSCPWRGLRPESRRPHRVRRLHDAADEQRSPGT